MTDNKPAPTEDEFNKEEEEVDQRVDHIIDMVGGYSRFQYFVNLIDGLIFGSSLMITAVGLPYLIYMPTEYTCIDAQTLEPQSCS